MIAPTFLGRVGTVAGSMVSVRQAESVASGIAIIGGRSYRVGQVGSFVRIPQGYHDLYGIISEAGANATPEALRDAGERGDSWMLDRQYDFMLHPGDWEPGLDGKAKKDLPELLEAWFGHDKPVTVLDLSGVPSTVLLRLVGGILNITYEALFWGRELPEGARSRPQLVVMEEAHRYLGKDTENPARDMVQRIVKEGRKFGVGAMIVSQRPSEIDETILSQCGTLIALRLSNTNDRGKVQAALPDSLSGLIDALPVLRTGEALIMGEAAKLPIRCRITLPPEDARPSSGDPAVAKAWSSPRGEQDYERLAAAWRSQDPKWKPSEKDKA